MSKLIIFLSTRKISPIIIHSKIRSTLTTKSALGERNCLEYNGYDQ